MDLSNFSAFNTSRKIMENTNITKSQIVPLIESVVDDMVEKSVRYSYIDSNEISKFSKENGLNTQLVTDLFVDTLRELGYTVSSGNQYNETYYNISINEV
ncbi:hypothetical protein HPMBJEAJ_00361 [Aeromonas phage avDM6]|nr:hypothetical protein HPMBJEAJ_00361 [Aeromonas phage avDM6]